MNFEVNLPENKSSNSKYDINDFDKRLDNTEGPKFKEQKDDFDSRIHTVDSIESENTNIKNIEHDNNKKIEKDKGNEIGHPIKNKEDGLAREKEVSQDLEKQYPEEKGYQIISEAYLRDEQGNIVKDPETGEGRRIDFVVTRDNRIVDSIEVTSQTSDKTKQSAKEDRIREAGGNFIKDDNDNLIKFSDEMKTRIERRE